MHKRIHSEYQVAIPCGIDLRKRHRTRLAIARATPEQPNSPSPRLLPDLSNLNAPVFLVSERSKYGEVRSLVMQNRTAAGMLSRRKSNEPFKILTRLKKHGKWQAQVGQLEGGPLHHSVNVTQRFLADNGKPWATGNTFHSPSMRVVRLLDRLDITTPQICSAALANALIHAHHFARDFDATFHDRPWVNGRDAREISFEELRRSA